MLGDTDMRNVFPPGGIAAPYDRQGQSAGAQALPADAVVFSADSHISLSEDIWYERFPAELKDRAPRIWWDEEDRIFQLGVGGQALLPKQIALAVQQFERMPASTTGHIDARLADLGIEGVDRELVFPNGILMLLGHPDLEVRDLCFRIYNEYLAELQERAPGRFYGVGLVNWWDPAGTRRALSELKALGLKTFLMPMKAGVGLGSQAVDWTSTQMTPVWEEIEDAGIPVSHHIGEAPQLTEFNFTTIGFLYNCATFREMFGKYIFGGILDRHPGLRVGWFEGGINWVVSILQDADHAVASYKHMHNWKMQHEPEWYWRNHMYSSFIVDPLGLQLIDRIGADRVMWSSDYPHNESSFGYSRSSLQQVLDIVGAERTPAIIGGNVTRFLKL